MMSLAKTGFDEKEYSTLAGEIDLLRERMQRLKGQQTEQALPGKICTRITGLSDGAGK